MIGYQTGRSRILGKVLIKAQQTLARPQVQARLEFLAEDLLHLPALDLLQHAPDQETRRQPHQDGDDGHGYAPQEAKEEGLQVDSDHGPGLRIKGRPEAGPDGVSRHGAPVRGMTRRDNTGRIGPSQALSRPFIRSPAAMGFDRSPWQAGPCYGSSFI